MKNVLICGNCKTENSFYSINCKSCNAFLRSKIVNIDLWDTLWKLLESPVKTAETIIRSEHKNFVVSILLLAGIKIGLLFLIASNAFFLFDEEIFNPFNFVALSAVFFCVLIALVSYLITFMNKLFGIENRFKDNLAVYVYSFLPIVLTLMILSPIQLAVFGIYWFSFNPSPLLFKPMAAYVMIFMEGLFYLWSILLCITSSYAQTKSKLYSVAVGLVVNFILMIGVYFLAKLFY